MDAQKITEPPLIERFKAIYQELSLEVLPQLDEVYSNHVQFADPVHQIDGVLALREYLADMLQNARSCRFQYHETAVIEGQAFIKWQMQVKHPRLKNGREIQVKGISEIRYNDKIYFHEDYYDVGAMLYENVPVLGGVVRLLKRRMQGD